MAELKETPLDEICFSLPPAVEHFRGIRPENIHLYFLASPFCDPTSNNKQVEFQNNRHPEGWRVLADRDSFENRVKKIGSGGIDYYVEGAKVSTQDANPVWVITRNQREIVDGASQTKLTGTYFAFGERIYQAPSIADVISSRLAYTSTLLNESFKQAAEMQYYTPAAGYSYFPPVRKESRTPIGAGSTRQSRAGTPMAESTQQSQLQSKIDPDDEDLSSGVANDDSMLMASFNAALMYRDEYIDENPLQGEPGSFVFAHSNSQVQSQKERERLSQQHSQEKAVDASATGSSRGASAAPTPPPLKTEGLFQQRKGGKVNSPTSASPVSGSQSANPYKIQKTARRKSKGVPRNGNAAA